MSNIGIEGVYHVYIKWSPMGDVEHNTTIGRTQLTFRNRQTADEFYRFLLTATEATGKNLAFASVVRNGPQFWYFEVTQYAGANWELPRYILQWNPKWGQRVKLTLLHDWNGRILDTIVPQATTEWINGGAYFIKNTNVQTEFWFSSGDNRVTVSNTDRTKFVLRAPAFDSTDQQVLIRSDKITIELSSKASSETPRYVAIAEGSGNLILQSRPYTWTFNDFFVSFGIERVTNSTNVLDRVIDFSPGTSVVWDLV